MSISPRHTVFALLPPILLFAMVVPLSLAGVPIATGPEAPSLAGDVTEVQNCRTISEPGTYVLTRDIENGGKGEGNFTFASQACIRIESSDVTFDGNGHVVDGFGVSHTTGIRVGSDQSQSNVTVANVDLTDWNRGIHYMDVTDGTVRDANVSGNSFGIFVENSTDIAVRNVAAHRYFVGVYLGDTEATLTETSFTGNETRAVVREQVATESA